MEWAAVDWQMSGPGLGFAAAMAGATAEVAAMVLMRLVRSSGAS